MSHTDPKSLKSQLKKGEIKNLYYVFGPNIPDVERITKQIIKAAVGDNEDKVHRVPSGA